jgi:DNA polymerase-3 subunit delta
VRKADVDRPPVHLLRGDDPTLLVAAMRTLVDDLVGDTDRSLAVEDLSGDDYQVADLVDAAQTPPFLTDRRVVVGRGMSRFNVDQLGPLVAYLADPAPTTDLVLTWDADRAPPKALADAVKKAGGSIVDTSVPSGKAKRGWLDDAFAGAPVKLDAAARALVVDRLGEDVGRLAPLFATLASAYGRGAHLGPDDVEPLLGGAGAVPPWDLTDAIDQGRTAEALDRLHRMIGQGGRHPLVVMATLHNHYTRMLRLDGSGANDERAAAEVLGVKGSTFPARKALDQLRKLGPKGVADAVVLLAGADLDLRGRRDWPETLVMEVLVARLSRLVTAKPETRREVRPVR